MEYGKVVDFIRRTKNITVKEVCGDTLTRQTYYRFVNNDVEISYVKFFHILSVLNINADEFIFIANNYRQSSEYVLMDKIRKYFETNDIDSLKKIVKIYPGDNTSKRDCLLNALASVLLAKLTNQKDKEAEMLIREYLFNIETWTHYETVLFNNAMFIFEDEFIELIYSKAMVTLTQYSTLRYYGSEACRMYINIIILFIDRKQIDKARTMLDRIRALRIQDDWLYEKLCIRFFTDLIKFLDSDNNSFYYKKCENTIEVLKNLEAIDSAQMFKNYLSRFVS